MTFIILVKCVFKIKYISKKLILFVLLQGKIQAM